MPTPEQKRAAIELAIEHIIQHGLDDIAKPPTFRSSVELGTIQANADAFRTEAYREANRFLNAANLRNQGIGNPQYYMVPRDEHTLRRVAWIDPFDLVKYLSVSLLLFPQIESGRSPKDHQIIHSHRLSTAPGAIFDSNFGYDSFRRASSERSAENRGDWKVITDISNFFDRIGNHPLENHLHDCGCDAQMINLARDILFQWSGDRRSYGVPVGSDASRILSEAALIAVDRQLVERGINYVRYVDDFRLFASSRAEAYDLVRLLSELLAEEGLNLNNRKTRVFQIDEVAEMPDTDETDINSPHEQIDEEERVIIRRRVQVSGRSAISRFYRHPGRDAIRHLESLNYDQMLERVLTSSGAEQEDAIREATKYFLYVRQNVEIVETLIRTKITSVFYVVDALIKDSDRVDERIKTLVKDVLIDEMGGGQCSYPFQIPLLRLCASRGYEDTRLANAIVDNQRQLGNLHFFREAILLGFQQMDRHRIRRLATEVFRQATPPLQRAIIFAVKNYSRMNEQEKRPIIRNMELSTRDWFVHNI